MDKMLRLLETFKVRGSDGKDYAVRGYEHLVRWDVGAQESWEPTGLAEYKLADGRNVNVDADGGMSVPALGLRLERLADQATASSTGSGGGLVPCDVCLREVPLSEAVVPEAADYVCHFCGLDCFAKWKDRQGIGSTPR